MRYYVFSHVSHVITSVLHVLFPKGDSTKLFRGTVNVHHARGVAGLDAVYSFSFERARLREENLVYRYYDTE